MASVRELLLRQFPPYESHMPPDDEIAHSLDFLLWRIEDESVCVDGWLQFHLVRESETSLEAVGLMTLLPTGSVPLKVSVSATESGLPWSAQLARPDSAWHGLSSSKQWKQFYLYAAGDLKQPPWTWGPSYEGSIPRAGV